MIYSRSTEYAIRALIPLSKAPEGKYTMVKAIAEQEQIPTHFLAKILQQLARKGLLRSSKGPMGGFSLRVPAEEIRLLDLVEALEGIRTPHLCIGGFGNCTEDQQCSMHEGWAQLHESILDFLKEQTIANLAKALEQKKKALARKKARRAAAGRKN